MKALGLVNIEQIWQLQSVYLLSVATNKSIREQQLFKRNTIADLSLEDVLVICYVEDFEVLS